MKKFLKESVIGIALGLALIQVEKQVRKRL